MMLFWKLFLLIGVLMSAVFGNQKVPEFDYLCQRYGVNYQLAYQLDIFCQVRCFDRLNQTTKASVNLPKGTKCKLGVCNDNGDCLSSELVPEIPKIVLENAISGSKNGSTSENLTNAGENQNGSTTGENGSNSTRNAQENKFESLKSFAEHYPSYKKIAKILSKDRASKNEISNDRKTYKGVFKIPSDIWINSSSHKSVEENRIKIILPADSTTVSPTSSVKLEMIQISDTQRRVDLDVYCHIGNDSLAFKGPNDTCKVRCSISKSVVLKSVSLPHGFRCLNGQCDGFGVCKKEQIKIEDSKGANLAKPDFEIYCKQFGNGSQALQSENHCLILCTLTKGPFGVSYVHLSNKTSCPNGVCDGLGHCHAENVINGTKNDGKIDPKKIGAESITPENLRSPEFDAWCMNLSDSSHVAMRSEQECSVLCFDVNNAKMNQIRLPTGYKCENGFCDGIGNCRTWNGTDFRTQEPFMDNLQNSSATEICDSVYGLFVVHGYWNSECRIDCELLFGIYGDGSLPELHPCSVPPISNSKGVSKMDDAKRKGFCLLGHCVKL